MIYSNTFWLWLCNQSYEITEEDSGAWSIPWFCVGSLQDCKLPVGVNVSMLAVRHLLAVLCLFLVPVNYVSGGRDRRQQEWWGKLARKCKLTNPAAKKSTSNHVKEHLFSHDRLTLVFPPLPTAIKVNCQGSCGISSKINDSSWTLEEQYLNSTLSVADKGKEMTSKDAWKSRKAWMYLHIYVIP